jgi:thiol-disulfide isomerase/thioredoxin
MSYTEKYLKYKTKYINLKTIINNKNDNSRIMSGGGGDEVKAKKTLCLFKATWCMHCKNFQQTWENLQHEKKLKKEIIFKTYDSVKDEMIMKEYGIKGYPTLILKSNDTAYEYSGELTIDGIKSFINSY